MFRIFYYGKFAAIFDLSNLVITFPNQKPLCSHNYDRERNKVTPDYHSHTHLCKPAQSVEFKCTYCEYEEPFTAPEIRFLEKKSAHQPVFPLQSPCHIGLMIPFDYTSKERKSYTFNKIKTHIENLDPNTVMQRIFDEPNNQQVFLAHTTRFETPIH
ncbi:MAG: hypothetical protein GKR87_13410 [Kiritimatiellae bacterium]|nr:hypothetical protein [Kiritimatiellia bacterium]